MPSSDARENLSIIDPKMGAGWVNSVLMGEKRLLDCMIFGHWNRDLLCLNPWVANLLCPSSSGQTSTDTVRPFPPQNLRWYLAHAVFHMCVSLGGQLIWMASR